MAFGQDGSVSPSLAEPRRAPAHVLIVMISAFQVWLFSPLGNENIPENFKSLLTIQQLGRRGSRYDVSWPEALAPWKQVVCRTCIHELKVRKII